jgi:hypothetical protein
MMDRQVVIKVISRSLLDNPDALERFLREVQAAAQLSHPNIVTAYDAEQAGELHMLVMEFVPGQSLAEILEKKGPLPVANACHYVRQAALGLQHAHERGMVHRDIKPGNLMLMTKGQVKILDFGLAKVVRERGASKGLTSSDAYMGTPDYSAPEQATDARAADIRADLYSLGCTLYCLLAGRPPFQEDTAMKTILAHLQKEPQPLTELRSDVPAELWQVVKQLLAKDSAQRYQKPIDVARALSVFVKPDAKGGPAPVAVVGSPGERTVIAANASQIKKVLREVPGKTPPREMPAKNETSPFENLKDTSAHPREAKGARESRTRVPARRSWLWPLLAGVGVLLLVLLGMWASGVFKVKTKDGTIVLENLPPDAEVLVDGGTVTVKSGDGDTFEVRVDPGKTHRLEVKKAGFKVFGAEVEIDAGRRKSVAVRLVPIPKDGTIVLENLLPDDEVLVDGGTVAVKWGDGKKAEVRVAPGKKHRIEVKNEGFKVFGEEVEVDAGGSKPLLVRLEPAAVDPNRSAPRRSEAGIERPRARCSVRRSFAVGERGLQVTTHGV